jgi:hypothetical protein
MRYAAGSEGADKPVNASLALDINPDALTQRRLVYAERCENLIQALQFVSSVLRRAPAGGNAVRDETAHRLSERLPPELLEDAFDRIDAAWAAWNRPDTSPRNRESVQRHARMVLLAAVQQAANFVHLSKVTRASARSRAGYSLSAEEQDLVESHDEATVAGGLLDGEPYLAKTLYGDLQYERDDGVTLETIATAELPPVPELVRYLVSNNGYPDVASTLTDEQAERLVRAWPKSAGRPPDGERANWGVIVQILADLGLGRSANVRKDLEAFRRENGTAPPARWPTPRGHLEPSR